jgi:hypothetical protein
MSAQMLAASATSETDEHGIKRTREVSDDMQELERQAQAISAKKPALEPRTIQFTTYVSSISSYLYEIIKPLKFPCLTLISLFG